MASTALTIDGATSHTLTFDERPPAEPGHLHKWWATCTCGYRSTTRYTWANAVSAAVHHKQTNSNT